MNSRIISARRNLKSPIQKPSNFVTNELRELGMAALPQRTPNDVDQSLGWQNIDDQYKVLKTIEHLLNKSKTIENAFDTKNDNILDPLSATTKQQISRIDQLRQKESELNNQIKDAKKQLSDKKKERKSLQTKYSKELKELESMILSYQR